MSKNTKKLCYAAVCLALAMVLPFLTGQIPQIGQALSPMHIPVFLCGFLCGWPWGLAVGFIAPLMRSVLFGMPAIFPGACAMAFELAAYGAVSGFLYRRLRPGVGRIYLSLLKCSDTPPQSGSVKPRRKGMCWSAVKAASTRVTVR